MHTVYVIAGGFALLGIAVVAARWFGSAGAASMVTAAKVFIAAWLVVALVNMWFGVSRAGYSVSEELPMLALVFAVPAAAALWVWWKFS